MQQGGQGGFLVIGEFDRGSADYANRAAPRAAATGCEHGRQTRTQHVGQADPDYPQALWTSQRIKRPSGQRRIVIDEE